jgi:tight adherence protein B
MTHLTVDLVCKLLAVAAFAVALTALCLALAGGRDTMLGRMYYRYVLSLERRMRILFIATRGSTIVIMQVLGVFAAIALGLMFAEPLLFGLVPAVVIAPGRMLERMRKKRVAAIEAKLDGFVVALANALRATPSAGRALAMVQGVTPPPLDRELELVLREMRVGSTLEQALQNMSARVRSFELDAALSGLLIGRQTGGDVPRILDGAANTLREMARLRGVLRTKTADSRAQANVLAFLPAGILFAFNLASPGYFRPLTESSSGMIVTAISASMWIASVVMTRKIMDLEL